MAVDKEQQEKDRADFAEQFNADDPAPKEMSEDEAFGMAPEPEAGDGGAAPAPAADAANAAAPVDAAAADQAAAPAAPADAAATEQRLRSWEGRLKAREAELDAKEASIATTNVGEQQAAVPGDAGADAAVEGAEDDPGKALAADFGEEFVAQLRKLIEQVCGKQIGDGIGGVSDTVQSVIDHLNQTQTDNHFKAIKAAHEDFMEIIDSPEFGEWKAGHSPEKQADVERVVQSGSTQEVIAMLTDFKKSKAPEAEAGAATDEQALEAAEGIRSSGLRLPKEPTGAEGYEKAWNES